jgi:hypothetical protein
MTEAPREMITPALRTVSRAYPPDSQEPPVGCASSSRLLT